MGFGDVVILPEQRKNGKAGLPGPVVIIVAILDDDGDEGVQRRGEVVELEPLAGQDEALDAFLAERKIDAEGASELNRRYDAAVKVVDDNLGRLLQGLEAHKSLTVALTSNQGLGLGQHGEMGGGRVFNAQLFVPLFIRPAKDSGVKPARLVRMASLVDVLPTAMRLARALTGYDLQLFQLLQKRVVDEGIGSVGHS